VKGIMKILMRAWITILTSLAIVGPFAPEITAARNNAERSRITVFAAVSMTNVITEITEQFNEKEIGRVTTSFAASSTLAKQIENGAPADIFISADLEWMDYLDRKKMIEPSTRFVLAGNRIVIIANIKNGWEPVSLLTGSGFNSVLGDRRLALGDPEHVPAGRYAKDALECQGIWTHIKDRIAPCANVRSALMLVEQNEAPLGIVYKTDAMLSRQVRVVGRFPENCQPDITYPAAIIIGRISDAAIAFIDYLKTDKAVNILIRAGFTTD